MIDHVLSQIIGRQEKIDFIILQGLDCRIRYSQNPTFDFNLPEALIQGESIVNRAREGQVRSERGKKLIGFRNFRVSLRTWLRRNEWLVEAFFCRA